MYKSLLTQIRDCTYCQGYLPYPPKPVLNFNSRSKIIIIGQAPGIKVHQSGIPWNDASGERLRNWLDVSTDEFYEPENFAIVPMGFCYPGKDSKGDLPPRSECAELWMEKILSCFSHKQLTILLGQYSQNYFLHKTRKKTLTKTVKNYKEYLPGYFVLPHPSPRNNIWLKKNPWFLEDNIPEIKLIIRSVLS